MAWHSPRRLAAGAQTVRDDRLALGIERHHPDRLSNGQRAGHREREDSGDAGASRLDAICAIEIREAA